MYNPYFNNGSSSSFQNQMPQQPMQPLPPMQQPGQQQANPYQMNPNASPMFGQNMQRPYTEGMGNMITPQPLPGSPGEQQLYPLESSTATPQLNLPQNNTQAYKNGGQVKMKRGGFFRKPFKAIKSVLGGGAGAILGNLVAPGIGGIIGGALGQGIQHGARGKSVLSGALKGAGMGAALPSAASFFGSGANAIGMNGVGNSLSNYGTQNAILPSLGRFGDMISGNRATGLGALGAGVSAGGGEDTLAGQLNSQYAMQGRGNNPVDDLSFSDKLLKNTKDFATQPANLLSLGVLANSMLNRPKGPKEKSPEQIADEQKRLSKAMMLNPDELSQREAYDLQREQSARRIARNKYLPEERLGIIEPRYAKSHSPEEYARTGKWLSYYNNPEFQGEAVPFANGGEVGLSRYLDGDTGGQDDKIPALLSDGEYVMDASTVSDFGDGNSARGAKKLDEVRENIRKHKRGGKIKMPPKAKSFADYMR